MTNLELAKDPNTLPETLQHLATDDDWHVRTTPKYTSRNTTTYGD